MKQFQLTDSLMIGHAQIDSEHEHLLLLLNELAGFHKDGNNSGCAAVITKMTKALKNHLENEFQIMDELGCWNLDEHQILHSESLKKYDALIDNVECNGYGSDFINELASILMDDFIKADMSFKSYLQSIAYQG